MKAIIVEPCGDNLRYPSSLVGKEVLIINSENGIDTYDLYVDEKIHTVKFNGDFYTVCDSELSFQQ